MMNDPFEGLDDEYSDPNGPAYQKTESRTGPPLEYVSEKLRSSIERLHALNHELASRAEREAPGAGQAPAFDSAKSEAEAAFYYALVAWLALNNMLSAANPPSFSERLAAMPRQEFRDWLDNIQLGGSVS
jgi:hypothetical protein